MSSYWVTAGSWTFIVTLESNSVDIINKDAAVTMEGYNLDLLTEC